MVWPAPSKVMPFGTIMLPVVVQSPLRVMVLPAVGVVHCADAIWEKPTVVDSAAISRDTILSLFIFIKVFFGWLVLRFLRGRGAPVLHCTTTRDFEGTPVLRDHYCNGKL